MHDRRCENCEFYNIEVNGPGGYGWCHRYPPFLRDTNDGGGLDGHPLMHPRDWCGEFRPREANHSETPNSSPRLKVEPDYYAGERVVTPEPESRPGVITGFRYWVRGDDGGDYGPFDPDELRKLEDDDA